MAEDMSSGLLKPYIVGAFFGVPGGAGMVSVGIQGSASPENASANLVAGYYQQGGRLPLVGVHVIAVTREQAQVALSMLDAIDEAAKAKDQRVVSIVPNGTTPQPDHAADSVPEPWPGLNPPPQPEPPAGGA